jgi:hypothetical protein
MGDGEARLYLKGLRSKNVSSRDVNLSVYDWVDKTYVGSVTLDPGQYQG